MNKCACVIAAVGFALLLEGATQAANVNEFADYEAGDREDLSARYPEAAGRIRALTREGSPEDRTS